MLYLCYIELCLDAQGSLPRRVAGGPERLSGASGWRDYLLSPIISSAGWTVARTRPGSDRRLGLHICGEPAPQTHTVT